MSIESEITRLQGAKADLKDAIEAKGVTVPSSAKLDDYADYVEDIPTGGGASLETKSASYTPSELAISQTLTPSTGYDGFDKVNVSVGAISSNYVGSTVPRKDSTDLTASGATVTAPAGYYASNGSKTIASAGAPEVYVATIESDGKITAQVDINNSGYIDADTYLATTPNAMVTPRSSSDLTASGATVTAPAGYYSANATKTIPNASAPELLALANINADGDVTVDVGIATSGYISSGNYVLTIENEVGSIGAQTYIPGTTDQEIDGHQWIAGTQTILGDADLVASNIKKDVEIFGVTGTYEGGVTPTPDPYHISIDGTEHFFLWGGADWNNNRACQNANTGNRRSLWSASGDTVVYYLQNNGRTNLRLIPIPSDVTTMTLTLDQTCLFAVREYWGSGSSLTSSTSTSWLNITANTPYQFTLSSGSNYVGFSFRVDSSNSNYTDATEPTTASIDFS